MLRTRLGAVLASGALLAAGCGSPPADGLDGPGDTRPVPGVSDDGSGTTAAIKHIKGGRLLAVDVPMFQAARDVSLAAVLSAVKPHLARQLGGVEVDDLEKVHESDVATPSGGRLAHVGMQQRVGGVPVHGSYLNFTLRKDDSRGVGRVVATSYQLFRADGVDTVPRIAADAALRTAQLQLRVPRTNAVRTHKLELRELNGELQLVWNVAMAGSYNRALVIANGPKQGRVLVIDERVYEASGTVQGAHVTGGAPGGLGVPTTAGLEGIIVNAGLQETETDAAGSFVLDVPDGDPVDVRLGGVGVFVVDANGADLTAVAPAGPGMLLALGESGSDASALAQTTAYVFALRTREYLVDNGFPSFLLGAPLPLNTNVADVCNAFYSPTDIDLNFFAAGGGCNNSASDSVVIHEYGHFADDMAGGLTDGGLSEGWGDLLSCYILGTPEIGFDIFPGEALRSCDNDYQFPPGGADEFHALGTAWSGFAWQVRQGLIAELGPEGGDALARALVLPALASNAADIPSAVREVFLLDDDDGDLSNETPHFAVLSAAAAHHNLLFALETDDIAPAAVSDLTVAAVAATTVTLAWTATGDDGIEGTAAQYDLRVSSEPITAANFFQATPVAAPAPAEAGTTQQTVVGVPPETTLFFAMVVFDEQLNASELSNVASGTSEAGIAVYTEDFETGAEGWSADGLWHVTTNRAASGESSFWYGQEATGNYDTGDVNTGSLVSPVIDLSGAVDPVLVFEQFIQVEPDPFDTATITITNVDDPTVVQVFQKDAFETPDFVARVLPLAAFDGARIQLQLSFDTIDGILNTTEGWYVDNIRVIGSNGGPTCNHELCDEGGPLDPACDECTATVCGIDPFCCETAWDAFCIEEAKFECALTCDEVSECTHELCEPGPALEPECDECTAAVCAADDFCCTVFWDRVCVQEAEETCGLTCQGCAHDQCSVGEPLEATCDPCTEAVCAVDDYCCNNAWDTRCVAEAAEICGIECEQCLHDPCSVGEQLDPTCDPCVSAVCAADEFCCGDNWDARCVEQAQDICGLTCANVR